MTKLALLVFLVAPPLVAGELDDLYQAGRWFEFRDAVLQAETPPGPFYRTQLAHAFHDWDQAEKGFLAALKSDPKHWADAFVGLRWIYELTGRRSAIPALLSALDRMERGTAGRQRQRDHRAGARGDESIRRLVTGDDAK